MRRKADDVLSLLRKRGAVHLDTNEEIVLSYIEQAAFEIKAYCNIPEAAEMPAGLFYVWVEISSTFINGMANSAGGAETGVISSITEGDTTIVYEAKSNGGGGNDILSGYRAVLNRYRRLA